MSSGLRSDGACLTQILIAEEVTSKMIDSLARRQAKTRRHRGPSGSVAGGEMIAGDESPAYPVFEVFSLGIFIANKDTGRWVPRRFWLGPPKHTSGATVGVETPTYQPRVDLRL